MKVDETDRVLAVWFVGYSIGGDYMLTLVRRASGEFLAYDRLRMYDPTDPQGDPWNGKDFKTGSAFQIMVNAEQEAVNVAAGIFDDMKNVPCVAFHEYVPVFGTNADMFRILATKHWCHVKNITKEELEAINAVNRNMN